MVGMMVLVSGDLLGFVPQANLRAYRRTLYFMVIRVAFYVIGELALVFEIQ